MPPIDPQQLLKALGPLLTDTGGIRGAQEASRITRLMKDASKLVTRCVYLNILRATDSKDALQQFMEVGGWDILNTWLEMARDDNNEPLLGELLEVYLTMPVSVVLLKQNSAAKTIKQLSKTEKEKIKKTSALLVESWTKTIREQNSTADNNEEDKRRLKKKIDKERERDKDLEKNDKENDKKEGKDSEKAKIRERDSKDSKDKDSKDKDKDSKDRSHKDRKDRDKHKDKDRDKAKRDKTKTSSSSKDSSTSKPQSIDPSKNKDSSSASRRPSSADDSKSSSASSSSTTTSTTLNKSLEVDAGKDEPKRPKTVKQLVTKFRSTGLFDEEEEEEAESVKKKVDKLPIKRVSLDTKNEESMEKKPRLQLTMPTLIPANLDGTVTTPPEVTHGRIKLIAPKRAPAHEIQESNVFMDSLQQATFPSGRKPKKKLVSPSATTTPAMFKNSSATSPPSASSPPSATSPPSSTQASEAGPTSPPLLSPTTVMAQKLPSVPSFYRDTLDDMPESTSDTKKDTEQENESPPPVEEMEITEAEQEIENKDDQPVESTQEKSPEDKVAEIPSVTNTEAAQKLSNGKKSKKSVSWAREAHLEDFFYFEMDENERENVNRPKNFTDMKKAEMLLDRRAMESAKRFNNDTMVEVLQWKRPKLIDNAIVFETGINSVERRVQMEREQVVLCALFFNKVPDTPIEPDADISSDKVETKIIPLEDENGSCTEYEHTYAFNDPSSLPYDPEFGGLPLQNHGPPMNQVVNSIPGVNMHMANNMVPMTVNMGNMRGHMNIPAPISHILNTLQQQAQETRDPIMQNLQGMLTNVLQNTNPQDSSMLMERILNALEPFRTQIPGLSNLINSVTANSMDSSMASSMAAPRFMMPNQIGNTRHGLLGSAPPGFNMMAVSNMRAALPGQTPVMGNSGAGMGGNSNFFLGGGGGGGGNMRMGGPPSQWRGSNRSRPYSKRGGHRNIVCQFFVKKGLCKYGDSCQFIHPNPNS